EADEQKLVNGIVYEPDTVDAHGDVMTAAEIEKVRSRLPDRCS
ncbi:XkdF-like putative serine protease domain-containing protein, partial [Bacteroides uniformis]